MPNKRVYRPPLTTSLEALLSEDSDEAFRAMVDNLVSFAGRLQQIREAISRQMELSPPQYNIIMALAHVPATRATTSELASRLGVTVSFVVMETKRLEAKGLVLKETDLKDRRRMHISLTEQARVALADVAPLQRQVNDVLFSKLDRKSFKALGDLTRRLLSSCDDGLTIARRDTSKQTR